MTDRPKRVLVAEDEKPIAKAMELKLRKSGFEPTIVFDGKEALSVLEKENFDIIIIDLIMPKLDGFGVLEGIKKMGIRTPVIVSSNLSQKEDFEKTRELGAVDYFIKSDTPLVELIENIKRVLSM